MEESSHVKYEEEFLLNSRGFHLFTCRWIPTDQEPKALICICHGYGMECSVFMQGVGIKLASAGYSVCGIDYEGHGKSDGKRGYIESFQDVVDDCASYFKTMAGREEYKDKARFVYGESMGGAVALLLHRKLSTFWNGAVLVAPMCKIADNVKPPRIVITILKQLTAIIPTWKIVPGSNIIDAAFKEPKSREEIRANPYVYQGRPRLKTAHELLVTSTDLEGRLNEVTLPFLVLHGKDDSVTDPAVSEELYKSAASVDKTLKLYPDMWHGLTFGEPAHHQELVFKDIIEWLDERSKVGCLANL